jgi:hypothetical protein
VLYMPQRVYACQGNCAPGREVLAEDQAAGWLHSPSAQKAIAPLAHGRAGLIVGECAEGPTLARVVKRGPRSRMRRLQRRPSALRR